MSNPDLSKPFPDYVTCPHCTEPEVEVWCYDTLARCHACGQSFAHTLPPGCGDRCEHGQSEAGQVPTVRCHLM